MTIEYPLDAIVLLACAAVSVVLAWYVWQRRTAPGALYFTLLMACAAEWSLTGSLEMVLPDLQAKVLSTQLSYFSAVLVGPLWLLFALDYGRRRDLISLKTVAALCLLPAVTMAFVLTNTWHGLVWPQIALSSDGPGAVLLRQHGIVFWIHAAYSYLLLALGLGVMAVTAARSSGRDRFRALAILAGFAIVWAGCLSYVIPVPPLTGNGLAPLAMTATGFILTWLVFRDRLFDIVPVARETLIASMCDGVIVIDGRGTVAEMNPAALALLGAREGRPGMPADEVLGQWPDLCRCCRDGTFGTPSEILLDEPGGQRWLDIRISLLPVAGEGCAGRLIVMRDITELKCSHESLRAEMLERQRAEEQIRLSLREKEVLLKEIHHRVKNNMQIISSLLSLQSENISSENVVALRESQNRIKSMALIHEKLYRSRDLSHIDFGEYADGLASYLIRSYVTGRDVSLDIDVHNISLGIDLAIPCGLIINELVSNSLKYAFKDGREGTVHIGLARDGNTYTLRVSDDGRGLPQGFDYRDSPSLGLQLVHTLVGQLEGTIELESTAGTAYTIKFSAT